jgi:RTX calcium-binding nonapeptide repeat (4 copies)
MGCAVLVIAGCAGVRSEASQKEEQGHTEATTEEARCEGTRTFQSQRELFTTNDVPGCPNGGLLSGTDKADNLDGKDGDDEIRGLGGVDVINGGDGNDVIYAGDGNDWIIGAFDRQRDKLYCGEEKDWYFADKLDYVDSSCEKKDKIIGVP